jgi:hypothetical protein
MSSNSTSKTIVEPGLMLPDPRANDPALTAHLHRLQRFGPARDHALERERHWLVSLTRAVEDFTVELRALIVNPNGIAHGWRCTGPGLRFLDHDAARGLRGTLFGGGFVDERLSCFAFVLRNGDDALLLLLGQLRNVCLEIDRRFPGASIGEPRFDELELSGCQVERTEVARERHTECIERFLLFGFRLGCRTGKGRKAEQYRSA